MTLSDAIGKLHIAKSPLTHPSNVPNLLQEAIDILNYIDANPEAARATAEQRDSVIEQWIEETCAAYCIPKPFAIIDAIRALKSQQDAAIESQRSGDGS